MFIGPILFVSAHPDDVELFAGGTIAKLVEKKKNPVHVLLLTQGGLGGDVKLRLAEFFNSMRTLGVTQYSYCDYPDTKLFLEEPSVTMAIEKYIKKHKINTVFTHHPHDTHIDHSTAGRAALAAARKIDNVIYYQPSYPSGRMTTSFSTDLVVRLTESQVNKKLKSLSCHKSQIEKYGSDSYLDSIKAVTKANLLNMTGQLDGGAELFQVNRMVY